MPTSFPVTLDDFTNPTPADNLSTPAVLHSTQHANINDAVEALEAKIGVDGSAVASSLDYRVVQLEAIDHAGNRVGTANGLSLVGQALSLGLASAGVTGTLSGTDWSTFNAKQAALTFPLGADLGGTGIANAAGSTLTLGAATTITGGGTVALGGFTLTIPATGTAALLATANVFTTQQMVDGTSDQIQFRVQGHSTQTSALQTWEASTGAVWASISGAGKLIIGTTDTAGVGFFEINKTVTQKLVYLKQVSTALSGDNERTLWVQQTVNPASASSANFYGMFVQVGTNTIQNLTGTIRGAYFSVANSFASAMSSAIGAQYDIFNSAAGTLTSASGFVATIWNNSTGTITDSSAAVVDIRQANTAGTITDARGLFVKTPTKGAAGTIVNMYGVYIQNQNIASTLNYAIYTNIGDISFLGSGTRASAAGAVWKGIELRAATATISGSTNITTATGFNYLDIARPTLSAASALTVTNAATLYIANSPLGGGAGPATISNPYAIWVDDGLSRFDGGLDLSVANIQTDTTTGTKIGTATTQKLGFWNVAPIIQPAGATQAAPAAYSTGIFGLDSDANMHALYDLVVAMRTALVNTGIMKGAA